MAMSVLLRRLIPSAALLPGLWLAPSPAAAQGSEPAPAPAAGSAPAPAAGSARASAPAPTSEPPATGPDAEPAWERAPRVRRSGFTAGLAGGLVLGTAAGFPNDAKKIGRARYYTETGVGIGTGGSLWIGGALSDWLTFGIAVGGANLSAGDYAISSGVFMFHTEVFPLFWLGGLWREVGVIVDTGVGGSVTTLADSEDKLIDGGAISRIGGGVFYEGFRLWRISTGPWLYADYTWSATVRAPGFYLGWRTVVYTGP
jgi:hypothetical protein